MTEQQIAALVAAVALAAVHVLGGKLRFLDGAPRSRLLSAFGGVSVAYVFVQLLPELAEGQETIEGAFGEEGQSAALEPLDFLEHHVYLVALVGLAVFYGVERHTQVSRRRRREQTGEDRSGDDAFWLSIGSFAVYNAVIGYLLLRGELDELWPLIAYTLALGVHFVVNDFGLREHHRAAYARTGRWIIAAGVLVGWAVGVSTDVPARAIAVVLALIAGGVILNVLKEELPTEREARFLPFAAGALAFTVLLQLA